MHEVHTTKKTANHSALELIRGTCSQRLKYKLFQTPKSMC